MFEKFKNMPSEMFYKIVNFFLSGFFFTHLLPIMMFIIFMREEKIFSYDLLTDGLIGINTFYFFIVLFVLFFVFFTASSLYFIIRFIIELRQNSKEKYLKIFPKESKGIFDFFILSFILNIFTLCIYYQIVQDNKLYQPYVEYILVISVIFAVHTAIVFHAKAKNGFMSLIISFSIIISYGFINSNVTKDLVVHGLNQFGSNGNSVIVTNDENITIGKGKLLLLSPENIYFTSTDDKNASTLTIINRNNHTIKINR